MHHAPARLEEAAGKAGAARGTKRARWCAFAASVAALTLLVLYFLVAAERNGFQLRSYDYLGQDAILRGGIPAAQAASMLWKIGLLLPATLLLAGALTALGFQPRLPRFALDKRFPLVLALLAVLLIGSIAAFVLHGVELTDDENAYLFQAKTFLAGRLSNPPPPDRQSFANVFIINDGAKFVGMYPFGFPLLLALGLLLGSEYVTTLSLAGALIVLTSALARRIYPDRRIAIAAPLLLFFSPFYHFVAASRLSHVASSVLLISFALLFVSLFREETRRPRTATGLALACGMLAGLAANIRPLTALAFLLPFCLWILARLFSRGDKRLPSVLLIAAGFILIAALTLLYFKAVTGHYLVSPITAYDSGHVLGLGSGLSSLGRAAGNLLHNVIRMNAFLFGFPVSFIFVPGLLFIPRLSRCDRAAIGILGTFAVAYLFWRFPGVADLGPIYYFECLIPLIFLTSRGFLGLHDFVRARFPSWGAMPANFLLLSLAVGTVSFIPERLIHLGRLADAIDSPYAAIRSRDIHHAVVFIGNKPDQGWVFGYRSPSPDLDDDVILCRYADAESRARVMERFEGRTFYVLTGFATPLRYRLRPISKEELRGRSP